ncbi:MAG: insulinase family protein [Bacteroidales bacterium]|jgi:zinc protease|nr:insulinase family protein [Bacteroidales bacterium]MCI2121402.1 insulinase family protein [Bacteroidales bacterium]MCI2146230.1 insulinase family protein [Bacteroidales bacterium]
MKRIFTFIAALFAAVASFAQVNPQALLQKDTAIREGVLDNGMTYYIRHNDKPANRAEFYFFSNEGAIQETPAQAGLAHFQEHMCLNGTKNFPGKGIINYLQTIGASFGGNINASTGVEATMYMLNNIPLVRPGVIDTCLLIIHDYSDYVTDDPGEIDAERGVIREELRTRRNASWRMFEGALPYLYKGSKYATCNVIGTDENIANFPYKELQDFYAKWYRTDLQAVVVVGDVDVDEVEAKIKKIFGEIPAHEAPNPKEMYKIPDNDEPIIGVLTDPEQAATEFEVIYKSAPLPLPYRVYGVAFMQDLLEDVISSMINERLDDISRSADAPFINAGGGFTQLTRTCDALYFSCVTKDGSQPALKGLDALLTEIKKAKKYGFTEAEYERAKTNILENYESAVKNADTRKNSDFINGFYDEFFNGKPFMTPQYELEQAKGYFDMLDVGKVNKIMSSMPDNNMIVLYEAPEKEGIVHPTEEQIADTIKAAQNAEVAAPVEEAVNEPLMDASLLKGSKKVRQSEGKFQTTVWKLDNGITVYVRPSELKKDQVLFSAYMEGGRTLIPTEDLCNFDNSVFMLWNQYSGVSAFPATKLQKMLTGKKVSVSPVVNGFEHGFSANCSPKDFETMLQLVYLEATEPRFDENEFEPAMTQLKAIVPNMEKTPNMKLQRRFYKDAYGESPRREVISSEMIDKIDLSRMESVYKELFGNFNGMNVIITGNVQLDSIKPLVSKYLGSLPGNRKEQSEWINRHDSFIDGKVDDVYPVRMETPKATYVSLYSGLAKDNLDNRIMTKMMDYIMDLIFTDTIREQEGGTYGVSTYSDIMDLPVNKLVTQISFETDPAKADKLINMVRDGFREVAEKGFTEDQISKAKENLLKDASENRINNSYWSRAIKDYYRWNIDVDSDYEQAVNSITGEKLQAFVKNLLDQNNCIELTMVPDTTATTALESK